MVGSYLRIILSDANSPPRSHLSSQIWQVWGGKAGKGGRCDKSFGNAKWSCMKWELKLIPSRKLYNVKRSFIYSKTVGKFEQSPKFPFVSLPQLFRLRDRPLKKGLLPNTKCSDGDPASVPHKLQDLHLYFFLQIKVLVCITYLEIAISKSSSNPHENFQSMKQPLRVRRTPKSKFETAPTISLQKFFLTVFVSVDAVKDMFCNIVIVVTKALVSSPQYQMVTHCYLLMERVSIPSQNLQRLLIQTARPWPREKRAAVFAKNLVLEKA